ncbi:MAG: hypothetical protein KatS3mg015_1901 [Fimbriimonadales bacterium]|nr:MAG: hypothetical protein KatS3mg015_1901 [Fimbriimonadales bacterium]
MSATKLSWILFFFLVVVGVAIPFRHTLDETLIVKGDVLGGASDGTGQLAFHFYDQQSGKRIHQTLGNVEIRNGEFQANVPIEPIKDAGEVLMAITTPETSLGDSVEMAAPMLPLIPVWLQSATPGTQQIGHANISGTLIAGAIQSGFLSLGSGNSDTKLAIWQQGSAAIGFGVGDNQFRFHLANSANRFSFLDAPNGNELLTINGNGNVGIGIVSPGEKLQVDTSTNQTAILARNFSSSGRPIAVWGQTFAPGGIGTNGAAFGSGGVGAAGVAWASTGNGWGTIGQTASTDSSSAYGVIGTEVSGAPGHAVFAFGTLAATGTKSFQIDHPLDPENYCLNHFCSEGPEPYNNYRGNVVTDAKGYATVALPAYFDSINRDPTYHLTVIDDSDDFILAKVVREIRNNEFIIRTSKPYVKVSWEVKAIRNDRWVQRYGYQTEQEKEDEIKGKYLNPELYEKPKESGILYRPDVDRTPAERGAPAPPTQVRQTNGRAKAKR